LFLVLIFLGFGCLAWWLACLAAACIWRGFSNATLIRSTVQ